MHDNNTRIKKSKQTLLTPMSCYTCEKMEATRTIAEIQTSKFIVYMNLIGKHVITNLTIVAVQNNQI